MSAKQELSSIVEAMNTVMLTALKSGREIGRLEAAIDSLEACQAALTQVSDYLDNRDDCWDENIDKATDAIKTAMWRIKRQMDDLEDGVKYAHAPTLDELKRDDDRERAADIRAEQRAAR